MKACFIAPTKAHSLKPNASCSTSVICGAILSLPGGVFSAAGAGVKTNLLFFTKGRKTLRIWFYDLSHVKVGKKTPMTLAHFGWGPNFERLEDAALPATLVGDWREHDGNAERPFPTFARLLADRTTPKAESDFSWIVDFAARRAKAREDMEPHLAEVEHLKNVAVALKDKISALKKAKSKSDELTTCREQLSATERAGREAQAKADAIDAATFDLKAVNPRARVERDTRTPGEILDAIAAYSRTIEAALTRLREMPGVGAAEEPPPPAPTAPPAASARRPTARSGVRA